MATLIELIGKVDQMDPEDVICAKREWRPDSEARAFRLTEDLRVPEDAKTAGYEYFLEVDVIRQVLEEFAGNPNASLEQKCQRVIHYAIYDA